LRSAEIKSVDGTAGLCGKAALSEPASDQASPRWPASTAWERHRTWRIPPEGNTALLARVAVARQGTALGTVEAPDERVAEAAAVEQFALNDEQRKRLAVREE
jgi:hypothetical protein